MITKQFEVNGIIYNIPKTTYYRWVKIKDTEPEKFNKIFQEYLHTIKLKQDSNYAQEYEVIRQQRIRNSRSKSYYKYKDKLALKSKLKYEKKKRLGKLLNIKNISTLNSRDLEILTNEWLMNGNKITQLWIN